MATFFYGCQKDSITQDEKAEENIILFDDPTLLENISPNFYDNHIYRVEMLGNNDELCDLISRVSNEGISADELNIYGIKKHYFNNSDVLMYSIPSNYSEDRIIVYQYDDIAEITIASYEEEGNIDRINIKTTDGVLYYSMQVNVKGQFGNIISAFNPRMENFNDEVFEIYRSKLRFENEPSNTKVKAAPCCRKADGIMACINCTSAAARDTFLGTLTLSLFGPEAYFAIGVSCINANPRAVC